MAEDSPVSGGEPGPSASGRAEAGRRAPAEGGLLAMQQVILKAFTATGLPPAPGELAEAARPFGVPASQVLAKLAEADFIALTESGSIVAAYPFSAVPTAHRVRLPGGLELFAMCAIDALGIPRMLGSGVVISSADPVTGAPITVSFSGKDMRADPAGTVVYLGRRDCAGPAITVACGFLNFFESAEVAEAWSAQHPEITGAVVTLTEAAELGGDIFGELLAAPDEPGIVASGAPSVTPG